MSENACGTQRSPVDRDILIFAVVILILLVGSQSFIVGWGLNKAAALTSEIKRQPDHLLAFIKWLALIILPLVAVNAAIGLWIARAVSAPLMRIKTALNEVTRGNLEYEFILPPTELLQNYTKDCYTMLQTLRRLTYRDRQSVLEAGSFLEQCRELLARPSSEGSPDSAKIIELLNLARSEISVINHHFTKGLKEQS